MFLHKFAGLLSLKIKLTALVCKQVGLIFIWGKILQYFFPYFCFKADVFSYHSLF